MWPAGLEENGIPWVLHFQDAKAKKRSDCLSRSQIVIEQEPRLPVFQVTCVSWDQIMSTCWSQGEAALAAAPDLPTAGVSFGGRSSLCQPHECGFDTHNLS